MREMRKYAQLRDLHLGETAPFLGNDLFKTVVNRAKNRLTQRAARQHDELTSFESEDGRSPERACAANRDMALIHQALNELPADCREAFRLVRLEGLSYDAAAQCLGLRPRQVRRHVARALVYCLGVVESATREGGMSRVIGIARHEVQAGTNITDTVQTAALSGRTLLSLKSWLPEFMNDSRHVVLAGRELPSQVGTTLSGSVRVLCVGPGEWLIVSNEYTASNLREQFAADLNKHGLALVDLTDGFAALDIRGSFAREVLSKGCGLDLHARSFPAGRCARTRFAQIPLVIEYLGEPPRFYLYVARSYFKYLHSWLTDAAAEFQGLST